MSIRKVNQTGAEAGAAQPKRAPPDAHTPESTRRRILQAGLRCFGQQGFSGATTRMIASSAGVTLPVIAYHFGNKEGLYNACAHLVLERYRAHMLDLVSGAWSAANGGMLDRSSARILVSRVLDALADILGSGDEERLHAGFIMRELTEPGPAYAYLQKELWHPGSRLLADLLAIAAGHPRAREQDKAAALLLISSLTAFTSQAAISLPVLKWDEVDDKRRSLIKSLLARMVSGLLDQTDVSSDSTGTGRNAGA